MIRISDSIHCSATYENLHFIISYRILCGKVIGIYAITLPTKLVVYMLTRIMNYS
jgi:hypothetical protein